MGPVAGDELVRETFQRVRNWGRWGPDDVRGTANLIDETVRLAGVATVRSGQVYPLGRLLDPQSVGEVSLIGVTDGVAVEVTCRDESRIRPHGFAVTHLDALSHCFFDGWAWNGRRREQVLGQAGLVAADAADLAEGLVTRGVLLDVAEALGLDYLAETAEIGADELSAAERLAGVTVQPGDAVVVRSGRDVAEGRGQAVPTHRAGIGLSGLEWLHAREVAVYSGDCVDRLPSPYPGYPDYFHQVALAGMGLVLMDLPDVERLRQAAHDEGHSDFLLVVSGPRVVGATGVAVNPLACF